MKFNSNIINRIAEESVEKNTAANTYNLNIKVKAKSLNLETISKLLSGNGNEVLSIAEVAETNIKEADKKAPIFKSNIGKRVAVAQEVVVAENITIKTPTNIFKVSQVVLPVGTIGIVSEVKNKKYVVDFETSIPIRACDIVEGNYTSGLTYRLDTWGLTNKQLEFF